MILEVTSKWLILEVTSYLSHANSWIYHMLNLESLSNQISEFGLHNFKSPQKTGTFLFTYEIESL